MAFDPVQFLDDHYIQKWTSGNNVTKGWVNIQCPFCDDPSNHGGFNVMGGYYNCWKCGWHSIPDVIQTLLSISRKAAFDIVTKYDYQASRRNRNAEKDVDAPTKCDLPAEAEDLQMIHRNYLSNRGFDPDNIVQTYHLKGTKNLGDYKFRIIAPIIYRGVVVSYQGRDVTDKQSLRYKTCKRENEVIHHKHIFYNLDNIPERRAVIVEGVTDVWRLGHGSIASFGIAYTQRQILLAKSLLSSAFILFDNDEKAQAMADRMAHELNLLGVVTTLIELRGYNDVAEIPQHEADDIMKELKIR